MSRRCSASDYRLEQVAEAPRHRLQTVTQTLKQIFGKTTPIARPSSYGCWSPGPPPVDLTACQVASGRPALGPGFRPSSPCPSSPQVLRARLADDVPSARARTRRRRRRDQRAAIPDDARGVPAEYVIVARALLHALGRGGKHRRGRRDDPPRSRTSCRGRWLMVPRPARCRNSARHFPDMARGPIKKPVHCGDDPPAATKSAAAAKGPLFTDERRATTDPARFRRRPAFASPSTSPGCRTSVPTTCSSTASNANSFARLPPIRRSARPECPVAGLSMPGVCQRRLIQVGNRRSGRDGSVLRRRRGGSVVEWFRCRSGRFDDRRTDARARLGVATGDESRSVQSRVASPT